MKGREIAAGMCSTSGDRVGAQVEFRDSEMAAASIRIAQDTTPQPGPIIETGAVFSLFI